MLQYHCYDCELSFDVEIENDYGTYELRRCPNCESAKTTVET